MNKNARRALAQQMRTRLIAGRALGLIALLLALPAWLLYTDRSDGETPPPGPEPTVAAVDPNDPYPVDLESVTAEGAMAGTVTNTTNRLVYLQCTFDLLDASGESAVTGTWAAMDEDGNPIESASYTNFYAATPNAVREFRVEGIAIEAAVASIGATCEPRPIPPNVRKQLEG